MCLFAITLLDVEVRIMVKNKCCLVLLCSVDTNVMFGLIENIH